MQRRQVETLDETPHQTRAVIVRQKPIQADRTPFDLVALGKSQAGTSATRRRRRSLVRQACKQPTLAI
jgi:hypothetical protein